MCAETTATDPPIVAGPAPLLVDTAGAAGCSAYRSPTYMRLSNRADSARRQSGSGAAAGIGFRRSKRGVRPVVPIAGNGVGALLARLAWK